MDTTKWKSILVPVKTYTEIKQIAHEEGRTISGQLRLIFEDWKRDRNREVRRMDAEALN
jgi:hypothetical protein